MNPTFPPNFPICVICCSLYSHSVESAVFLTMWNNHFIFRDWYSRHGGINSNNVTLKPWYNKSETEEQNQRSKRAYVSYWYAYIHKYGWPYFNVYRKPCWRWRQGSRIRNNTVTLATKLNESLARNSTTRTTKIQSIRSWQPFTRLYSFTPL